MNEVTKVPKGDEVWFCRYYIPSIVEPCPHYEIKTTEQLIHSFRPHWIDTTIELEQYFNNWEHPTKEELDYFEMIFDNEFRVELEKALSQR